MKHPLRLAAVLVILGGLTTLAALYSTGTFDTEGATATGEGAPGPASPDIGVTPLADPGKDPEAAKVAARTEARAKTRNNETPEQVAVAVGDAFIGRILDDLGNPLEGASVHVSKWVDGNGMQMGFGRGQVNSSINLSVKDDAVLTASDGSFRFPRERSLGSELAVDIRSRGFIADPIQHMLADEDVTDLGDFFLEPGVIIAGQVLDEHSAPVFEARIRRIDDGGDMMDSMFAAFGDMGLGAMLGEVKTDEEGRFEMPHERAGKLVLSVTHDAHLPVTFETITPDAGGAMTDILIELPLGGVIEGRVSGFPEGRRGVTIAANALDPDESSEDTSEMNMGDLMEAALMPAGDESAKVAADGSFRLEGLKPASRYELRAIEKRNFVEVVPLSEAVEAQAGATGVSLQYDAGAMVRFQVVDADTGKPIEKLKAKADFGGELQVIRLTAANLKRPKVFPDGQVTLYEVRPVSDPDTMTLRVQADDYLEGVVSGIVVGAKSDINIGKVRLKRAPRLRFLVLDANTKKPIHRASVALLEQDPVLGDVDEDIPGFLDTGKRAQERTDRSGRCELALFAAEAATLRVRSKDYAMYRVEDFALTPAGIEHTIYLSKGASIEINVADPAGNPVAGAFVYQRSKDRKTFERPHKTNADGQVLLKLVEPGEYQYRAVREGSMMNMQISMADDESSLAADDWETVSVGDGDQARIDLGVPGVSAVHGIVTSRGRPIEGARVSLMRADASLEEEMLAEISDQMGPMMGGSASSSDTTENDGRFRIENVAIESYKVRVSHRSRAMPVLVDIEVGGADKYVEVELPLTSVEGRVTGPDGSPILGARVAAENSTQPGDVDDELEAVRMMGFLGNSADDVRTDSDGHYVLEGVASGRSLRIRVKAAGFVPAYSKEVNLAPDELRSGIDVRMEEAGSVHVRLAETGTAQSLAFVRATWAGEGEDRPEPRMVLLRSGRATITELAPGPWRVRYSGSGDGNDRELGEPVDVEVVAGEQAEAVIES